MELFAASIFISVGLSLCVYLAISKKFKRGSGSSSVDLNEIEGRIADLITELNHVANTHVHSVEDRRDELKRVIENANQTIRRIGSMISDLSIHEQRARVDARIEEPPQQPHNEWRESGNERLVRETPITARGDRGADRVRARREIYSRIRELSGRGSSMDEIAKEVRVPKSEVEMVLRRSQ